MISHELGHLFGVIDEPSRLQSKFGEIVGYAYNSRSDFEINLANTRLRVGVTTGPLNGNYPKGLRRTIPVVKTYC
jgi:hypothetical protein